MKKRRAIKTDLFADEHHRKKIDALGDPLVQIESYIDFAALAAEVDRIAPRPVSPQGGRPPYPTETMVRILVLKRLYNLSDEQMAYQLLDRMSYKRFCGLANASAIPDRTTVWTFDQPAGRRTAEGGFRVVECGEAAQNRIGEAGAKAIFDGVTAQLLKQGFIARGGQIIDATLVPAPQQHFTKGDKDVLKEGAMPADWSPAKRRQKDLDQEARQEPLRLQALGECGQAAQVHSPDRHRHRQHTRQPALRGDHGLGQHEPGCLCRPGLSV